MLILTRRIAEAVIISDDIYLTILGIKGNQVRLGFDAPQGVTIHREEIQQKINTEQALLLKRVWQLERRAGRAGSFINLTNQKILTN